MSTPRIPIRTFEASTTVHVARASLAAWHLRPGALERLVPGWSGVRVLQSVEHMENGAIARLSVPLGVGFRSTIEAIHEEVREGESFVDRMIRGPFPHWRHRHGFEAGALGLDGLPTARLDDRIEYQLPFGPLGGLGAGLVRRQLVRMFRWRHERTRRDLQRHEELSGQPLTIAVSGATGLVGSALCAFLTTGGHRVRRIVRRKGRPGDVLWDVERGTVDSEAIEGVDAVVHLAGESIAARWTASKKRSIRESRIRGTELLARTLASLKRPPSVFLSASAIGYYGDRPDAIVTETSSRGNGFLADVCAEWEAAADPARAAGIRVVHPRIGMVLASAGGALQAMLTPFQFGLGGPIGHGRQGVSWIAIDDLLATILFAIVRPAMEGAYNAVAPESLSQRAFAAVLGRVLRRPAFAPLPAFMVRAIFGEMGRELLLAGAMVRPARLLDAGFRFDWPSLEPALRHELGRFPGVGSVVGAMETRA